MYSLTLFTWITGINVIIFNLIVSLFILLVEMVSLWDRVEPYQKCTASHHSWIITGYDIEAVCYPTPLMFIEITVYQYLDAKSFSNWRWEDGMISISLPPSISFLWPSLTPLVQIYFSPKPTAAVKIKDGSFNFHQQNTEHSLVKITRLCRLIDTNWCYSWAFNTYLHDVDNGHLSHAGFWFFLVM